MNDLRWPTCFSAAAWYSGAYVFSIFVLVKMGFPVVLIVLFVLSVFPAAAGYAARVWWKMAFAEILAVIAMVSVVVMAYGIFVRPDAVRFFTDLGALIVTALFNFAGFKIAQMTESNS